MLFSLNSDFWKVIFGHLKVISTLNKTINVYVSKKTSKAYLSILNELLKLNEKLMFMLNAEVKLLMDLSNLVIVNYLVSYHKNVFLLIRKYILV